MEKQSSDLPAGTSDSQSLPARVASEPPAKTGSESVAPANEVEDTTSGEKPKKPGGAAPTKKRPDHPRAPSRATKFAPQDLTDGREPLDWATKYTDPVAQRAIRLEACYLIVLFVLTPVSILLVWLRAMDGVLERYAVWAEQGQHITHYMLSWLGGTLGGTLFCTKWLYHSVAKQVWHLDRRLWRFFTPHLSGSLAFATFLMITSGLLPIIDKKGLDSEAMALSAGFIVGYFSDSATAKLTEVAETLFGSNRR